MSGTDASRPAVRSSPRLAELESFATSLVRRIGATPGLGRGAAAALSIGSDSPLFELLVRLETEHFPDAPFDLSSIGDRAEYLLIVTSGHEHLRMHHLVRTTRSAEGSERFGLEFLDELCDSGQDVHPTDVRALLQRHAIDLPRSLSVDCNVGLGGTRIDRTTGCSWAEHAYSAVCRSIPDISGVFAWLNPAAARSLRRAGWTLQPVVDREGVGAPTRSAHGMRIEQGWTPWLIAADDNDAQLRRLRAAPTPPLIRLSGSSAP